jgi:signal transduction histidine kinase/ActR/RegA family two-component response regulator
MVSATIIPNAREWLPWPWFLYGCGIVLVANLALHLFSLDSKNLPASYRLLPWFDIGFAPVLLATSGGALSPLIALFLLSVIASSLVITTDNHLPRYLFSASAAGYLGIALLQKSAMIPWVAAPAGTGTHQFFAFITVMVVLLHGAGYLLVRFVNKQHRRMIDALARSFTAFIEQRDDMARRCAHGKKMEAISRITGAIAHDFNNTIAAISGYASMLSKKLAGDEKCGSYISHIINASKQASVSLERFSRYGRAQQTFNPVPVDVNETIRSAVAKVAGECGPDCSISTSLSPVQQFTSGDPLQLRGNLICLLENAREACGNRGKIVVAVDTTDIAENDPVRSCFPIPAGSYIHLTVRDNGRGMSSEVLDRLFEPFFTTKSRMSGNSDLGLTNVWRYVMEYHGAVDVQSHEQEGTTFHLYLPPFRQTAEPSAARQAANPVVQGTPSVKNILIIDDEPSVREIYSEILSDKQYSVFTACDGIEAVKLLETPPVPIHLVLLDMIMPGMDGAETFKVIRRNHPDIKVLFMSGIVNQEKMASLLNEPGTAFFQKPCDDEHLLAMVGSLSGSAVPP